MDVKSILNGAKYSLHQISNYDALIKKKLELNFKQEKVYTAGEKRQNIKIKNNFSLFMGALQIYKFLRILL